ncbi:MAG: Rpn family recombination-promoting nuclease/putative transposase [Candidatus Poribacteria bacterium]|nr:Rpn family recombination-promoting nuclease/putative transposase [Candidatus Poribacteria bacterium]
MKNKEIEALTSFDFPIEHFHDRSTRWLLEDSDNVKGLLEIVAEHLVERLDFSRLLHVNRSFIPDNLREQESDLVYRVPFRGESTTDELLIYILIEHQSTVDTSMGFRVLFYMTQIWDFQRRELESNNIPKSVWRLRPIIPIVLYTGDQSWQTPVSLSAMMDLPDILTQFIPKFETLFLSVKDTDAADLTRTDHPLGWLLTVLQKENADKEEIRTALMDAVTHLDMLDTGKIQQWRRAVFYLYLLILHRRPPAEHEELKTLVHEQMKDISHKEEGETMAQSMAEYLIQQGKEEGEKRGEKRGEIRAKRESLLKLLELRFDAVPEAIINKISAIRSLSRLDTLFEQAATAQTLNEIDWDNA